MDRKSPYSSASLLMQTGGKQLRRSSLTIEQPIGVGVCWAGGSGGVIPEIEGCGWDLEKVPRETEVLEGFDGSCRKVMEVTLLPKLKRCNRHLHETQ